MGSVGLEGLAVLWRRSFCELLPGTFWDIFLLTAYDRCASDLSGALTVGQSWDSK